MPSRNLVNKPKNKIHRAHHSKQLSKKRAARASLILPTRSSKGRYDTNTLPRPTDSKAVALYNGSMPLPSLGVTTNTLSAKRARKIERNNRYIAKRNQTNLGMDVDMEGTKRVKDVKEPSQLDKVKEALWAVVEDTDSVGMKMQVTGEGTTIGVQAF